jgi:hypothetical protein
MRKIYRYELPVDGKTHALKMPLFYMKQGFRRVEAVRDDLIEFWIQTDHLENVTEGPYVHLFTALGTGHDVPDGAWILGTTGRTPSGLVWHLCEIDAIV